MMTNMSNTIINATEMSQNKTSPELQFSQRQKALLPHLHFCILQPHCNIAVVDIKSSFIDRSGSTHKWPFLVNYKHQL